MIALCIESSNMRGMGHLFRSLLFVEYLNKNNIEFIYLINNDDASLKILDEKNIDYIIVDYNDTSSNWEKDIIDKYCIDAWFVDKFETTEQMAKHVCEKNIKLFMMDEFGDSDKYADVHFAGMVCPSKPDPKGKEVLCGTDYIVLNKEIDGHRKIRKGLDKIIVTLGGSDPFNVTKEVVSELLKYDYDVDVVIGPNYKHKEELEGLVNGRYKIYQNVKSLIAMFDNYSLGITGGGFTCCEANACGLPSLIVANAEHEINTGKYVQKLGSSIYMGKHGEWNRNVIADIPKIDIEKMSRRGLELFNTNAIDKIFEKIMDEIKK